VAATAALIGAATFAFTSDIRPLRQLLAGDSFSSSGSAPVSSPSYLLLVALLDVADGLRGVA